MKEDEDEEEEEEDGGRAEGACFHLLRRCVTPPFFMMAFMEKVKGPAGPERGRQREETELTTKC